MSVRSSTHLKVISKKRRAFNEALNMYTLADKCLVLHHDFKRVLVRHPEEKLLWSGANFQCIMLRL